MKNKRIIFRMVLLLVMAKVSAVPSDAQIQTFSWDNAQRQYLLYEPSDHSGALPVMYFLHGLGDNITRCANEMHFDNLAERYGWVIVVPQATNVGGATMWNAGLGGGADDAGFLLALLDTLVADGKVNPDSVFFTGFSMGGFMTHRMAIEHGDRITACAPVSGLISFAFADEVPPVPVRLMHIHGTSDPVVGWNGSSAYFGTIGISVDSVVGFWTGWNNCDLMPTVDTLPDRVNDGLRFIRYTYSGEAEFRLLKVIGGNHTWYQNSSTHDIDYFDEIHRFFLGEESSLGFDDPETTSPQLEIWPNPTSAFLYVRVPEPTQLTLYDGMGRSVMQNNFDSGTTSLDLRSLPRGMYVMVDNTGSTHKVLRTSVRE